jgi:hypothetical protein
MEEFAEAMRTYLGEYAEDDEEVAWLEEKCELLIYDKGKTFHALPVEDGSPGFEVLSTLAEAAEASRRTLDNASNPGSERFPDREKCEEQGSDDYEGRLVTDGGVRQPSGAYLMPDGRLVAPKNPKPYPIPTREDERSVVEQPSTGPRLRRERFSDRIEGDGMDLYVDGYYEFRDEEDEPQEDEPSTWTPPPEG